MNEYIKMWLAKEIMDPGVVVAIFLLAAIGLITIAALGRLASQWKNRKH